MKRVGRCKPSHSYCPQWRWAPHNNLTSMNTFLIHSQTRKSGYSFEINSQQQAVKVKKIHYVDPNLDAVKYLTLPDARKFYKLLKQEEHEKFGDF